MSFIIVPIIVNIKIYPARYLDIDILTKIKLPFKKKKITILFKVS